MVRLPNTDVRTIGDSLRQLVADPNTMQLIPVPESSSAVIMGFGETLYGLIGMLNIMDEETGLQRQHEKDQQMELALIHAAEQLGGGHQK